MSTIKPNQAYSIECLHFDSEPAGRTLTVTGSEPGDPVLCDVNYHNKNQQFFLSPVKKSTGYNFTPVHPKSNIFVGLFTPGARVISTPDQKQEFFLRKTHPIYPNVYQIFVEVGNEEYAFQAEETSVRPGYPREITLQPSNPTNKCQMWRFVPVN
ncbi:hypothetical protein Clacol_009453 [Clathrus columnatus]|uniref:Ricin B lectin domain-containing protein n=1 Tax=Clathrus columnatus TaxID=1419009 RepID=A0AAV5AN55_9AGAM|nr:hypothetical protein Clacol_009453 [Clathrus columnatus]